jgi:hypothetical protein
LRSTRITAAPASAKRRAVASPIPDAAPVTSAVLPVRSFIRKPPFLILITLTKPSVDVFAILPLA